MNLHSMYSKVVSFVQENLVLCGALIVAIISLTLYLFTLGQYNPGYADSDEIITIGYLFGVPHPPGYPLFTLLTKLFTFIPIGSIAFRVGLLNVFISVGTLVFVYLIGVRILTIIQKPTKTKKFRDEYLCVLSSITGTLILGFTFFYWLYSIVIEVFSLHNLLAVLVVWLSLRWREEVINSPKKPLKKEFILFIFTAFIVGVGISNVQSFVLLLPALLVLFVSLNFKSQRYKFYFPRWLLVSIVSLISGFILPNLLLFWMNANKAVVSWYFDHSLKGWWAHVLRQDYNGYQVERGTSIGSYVAQNLGLGFYLSNIPSYLNSFFHHYIYIGIVLGLIGVWFLWERRGKIILGYLLTLYLLFGLFAGMYLSLPKLERWSLEFRMGMGVAQRQHLLGEVMWVWFVIIGIYSLITLASSFIHKGKYYVIISLACLGLVFFFVYSNFSDVSKKDFSFSSDYAHAVLENLKPNSLLLCSSDYSCFTLWYVHYVENVRPDVVLLTRNPKYPQYFLENNPDLRGLTLLDNPYYFADLISENLGKRPIYMTDIEQFYVKYLGLEANPLYIIPSYYAFEITTRVPEELPTYEYKLSDQLLSIHKPQKDYWLSGMQDYLAYFHKIAGIAYAFMGKKEEAHTSISYAIQLSIYEPEAKELIKSLNDFSGKPEYRLGNESSPSAYYLDHGLELVADKKLDDAYDSFLKGTMLDPYNREIRMKIADLLIGGGYYQQAADQYRYILKKFPDDVEVVQKLKNLETLL